MDNAISTESSSAAVDSSSKCEPQQGSSEDTSDNSEEPAICVIKATHSLLYPGSATEPWRIHTEVAPGALPSGMGNGNEQVTIQSQPGRTTITVNSPIHLIPPWAVIRHMAHQLAL